MLRRNYGDQPNWFENLDSDFRCVYSNMLILIFFLITAIAHLLLSICNSQLIYFFAGIIILSFAVMSWCAFRVIKSGKIFSILFFLYGITVLAFNICSAVIRIAMKDDISIELLQLFSMQSIYGILRYHWQTVSAGVVLLFFLLLLSWIAARWLLPGYHFDPEWNGLACFVVSLCVNLYYSVCMFEPFGRQILELYEIKRLPREYIQEMGIEGVMFKKSDLCCSPGYNLVHIFLESTEQNYADPLKFPGLAPELRSAIENGIWFSNIDMAPNANLTFGGIYASLKGFNMTQNMHDTRMGKQFVSLPDILHIAGYLQYFVYGHNSSFACFNEFLDSEHFNIVMLNDRRARIRHSLQYLDSIRDADLFESVWRHFERLSQSSRPFALTCLTVDAHAPNGVCDSDKKFYRWDQNEVPQLLHAIHNTDKALGKLIRRIRKSKMSSKTVIVIQSDHLSHPYTPGGVLERLGNNRKMLFLILSPEELKENVTTPGRTYDIAPTILHAMKVKHNNPFLLGRDLFMKNLSPKRLGGKEQQQALASVMLLNEKHRSLWKDVSFHEKPYPHIRIGTRKIAVLNEFSHSNDVPRNGECFKLEASRFFESCRMSSYSSRTEMEKRLNIAPSKRNHIFIFGSEKDNSGFYFIYKSSAKNIVKKSKTFSGVTFGVNEIFE